MMRLKIVKVKWLMEHTLRMTKITTEKTKFVTFRDPVVERVVDKFVERSDVGFKKYGTTLQEERTLKMKGLQKYLNDIQEELMDAVLYIQAARDELQDLNEESLIQRCTDEDIEEIL
jgi:hypothetical protein